MVMHAGLTQLFSKLSLGLLTSSLGLFVAANSVVQDVYVLTTSFHIHFTRPVTSGKVTAKGKLVFASRNLYIAESRLYNEQGKEVGFGTGHFAPSKNLLENIDSYKL